MSKEVKEEVEVEDEPKEGDEKKEGEEDEKKDDVEIEDVEEKTPGKEKEKKTKTVTKTNWEWSLINEIKAIWLRDKAQIEEREYNDFYKSITKDTKDPMAYSHFSAEGEIDFKSIIYIPEEPNYDIFDNYY